MLLLLLKNGQWDVCTGRRCSAKESVFGSLPNFCCPGKRSGMNRISHPNWVKLCVDLNCTPNQNTKFPSTTTEKRQGFFQTQLLFTGLQLFHGVECFSRTSINSRALSVSKKEFIFDARKPIFSAMCRLSFLSDVSREIYFLYLFYFVFILFSFFYVIISFLIYYSIHTHSLLG